MTTAERLPVKTLQARLGEPRDIASLAALRVALGLLLCLSTIRFMANGWVERFYVEPRFHFSYWGFEWIEVLSPPAMYALHAGMAVAALMFAVGLCYRFAAAAFFVLFTYVELADVTNYLNHYYLVSLLALLFVLLPLHGTASLDARLRPSVRRRSVPAWMLYLVRFQVGVVYVFAGLAKAQPDWLLHAQPLGIWLSARAETPLVGGLFALPETAYALSWAGLLHDLLIVPLLVWRRTRAWAYAALLVFHFFTHVLFTIGIFPVLMPLLATVFFEPDWPREIGRRLRARLGRPAVRVQQAAPAAPPRRAQRLPALGLAALAAWCLVQVGVPLRAYAYGGDLLWHEQGMRWGWRVMVREKNGSVTFRVRTRNREREQLVYPSRYLTTYQEREMSGQPDMILQLAHRIAEDYRARGERGVEVRADALVSLNGRPAAALIDPDVDLARVADGIAKADWILPAPAGPPLTVEPRLALGASP